MIMIFGLFNKKQPETPAQVRCILVMGTEFGSDQIHQLTEVSRSFKVIGFISDDSWQRRADAGRVGVYGSSEIESLCAKQEITAIVMPSDQRDQWQVQASDSNKNSVDPLDHFRSLIRHCDILSIPQTDSPAEADQFMTELIDNI